MPFSFLPLASSESSPPPVPPWGEAELKGDVDFPPSPVRRWGDGVKSPTFDVLFCKKAIDKAAVIAYNNKRSDGVM